MARILVLREAGAAAETAADLRARGHEPLLLPLHEIVPLDDPPPAGDFAGLLATSRNAVPALSRHFAGRDMPVLGVGAATARRLEAAGFAAVEIGEGAAASLVAPAAALAARCRRPLLLALGRVRRSDLEDGLVAAGVSFAAWEVYDTRPSRPDGRAIETALGGRTPDAVLLLSGGQANGFLGLLRAAPSFFKPLPRLLCLSGRIAAALPAELRIRASISADPDLVALFESLAETSSPERHAPPGQDRYDEE